MSDPKIIHCGHCRPRRRGKSKLVFDKATPMGIPGRNPYPRTYRGTMWREGDVAILDRWPTNNLPPPFHKSYRVKILKVTRWGRDVHIEYHNNAKPNGIVHASRLSRLQITDQP